ncbi:hypothetical protein SAMN05443637_13527 [Pseudonocardia thermophila]|uniref:Glycosyl hydrolases family 43 n=1 Tax=Pseudonocardia thermophila TaxID=1848 RepID=A0A1M7BFB3_PSETH|nr:hypothetical protein SAMN05443637_13527 [Pseudonocardia thermophila]
MLALIACTAATTAPTASEHADAPVAPAQAPATPPQSITITGVDLHDGTVLRHGDTYYLYGTMYGCGFHWGDPGTPWCGFGVSTAPSLAGPWSQPTLLFDPDTAAPGTGKTFRELCRLYGAGCFNPRVVQRAGWGPNDGAWILWFNAPADFTMRRANAYWVMGGNNPAGPFGPQAGPPFGSVNKPALWSCHDNGDFSLVLDNPRPPMLLCTMADQTLAAERLDQWGTGGQPGQPKRHQLAGATRAEAPGAYRDPATGVWIMTWNELNCGYCSGAPTSYATAPTVDGPWTSPATVNSQWGSTPLGRRGISATSCGGQPRTVFEVDGAAYQLIDLWGAGGNQTGAGIHFERLEYRGEGAPNQPHQPFTPWRCGA